MNTRANAETPPTIPPTITPVWLDGRAAAAGAGEEVAGGVTEEDDEDDEADEVEKIDEVGFGVDSGVAEDEGIFDGMSQPSML